MGFKSLDKLGNQHFQHLSDSFSPTNKIVPEDQIPQLISQGSNLFFPSYKSHDYDLVIKSPDFEEASFIEQGITQSLQKCCKVGETKAP